MVQSLADIVEIDLMFGHLVHARHSLQKKSDHDMVTADIFYMDIHSISKHENVRWLPKYLVS
jgi:hypothetical protein